MGSKRKVIIREGTFNRLFLREETMDNNLEVWYRGFDMSLGERNNHLLWLTDDMEYAMQYGNAVMEYAIDSDKLKTISTLDIQDNLYDDYWHPYDGIEEEDAMNLLKQGYNSYEFEANYGSSCLCLFDESPIVSRKVIKR